MQKQTKVRKGVIVAAGLGTRFLPITKSVPKEMLPVGNKPVLQYIVEEMADSGIEEIMIVIAKGKELIKDYFSRDKKLEKFLEKQGKLGQLDSLNKILDRVKFSYSYQKAPLGNGHALLSAKKFCGREPFVCSDADSIIAGSVPATKQLVGVFNERQAPVIGVQKITDASVMTKYGNVYGSSSGDKIYKVEKIIEKPELSNVSPHGLIVGGMRYVFTSAIWDALKKQEKGTGGEIWLADAADSLAKKQPFFAYVYEGKYLDTGRVESWLETNLILQKYV